MGTDWWSQLWYQIGISPAGAVGAVIATTLSYATFTFFMALWGRRLRSSLSLFSLSLVTLTGAVAARAMLGNSPTIAGGLIVLVTLFVLEWLFRHLRLDALRRFRPRACVVMVDGDIQHDLLRRCSLTQDALLTKLRIAGITHTHEVAVAVIESRGELTVIRRTQRLEPVLVEDLIGAHRIPREFLDLPDNPAS